MSWPVSGKDIDVSLCRHVRLSTHGRLIIHDTSHALPHPIAPPARSAAMALPNIGSDVTRAMRRPPSAPNPPTPRTPARHERHGPAAAHPGQQRAPQEPRRWSAR